MLTSSSHTTDADTHPICGHAVGEILFLAQSSDGADWAVYSIEDWLKAIHDPNNQLTHVGVKVGGRCFSWDRRPDTDEPRLRCREVGYTWTLSHALLELAGVPVSAVAEAEAQKVITGGSGRTIGELSSELERRLKS